MQTTIQISRSTLDRLKFFKEVAKESYDEVINKILDTIEEGELSDDVIEDLKIALKEVKEGKGQPIEEVAKEFGVKL